MGHVIITKISLFAIRRLRLDFKSYIMAMLDRDIELPGWLANLLTSAR